MWTNWGSVKKADFSKAYNAPAQKVSGSQASVWALNNKESCSSEARSPRSVAYDDHRTNSSELAALLGNESLMKPDIAEEGGVGEWITTQNAKQILTLPEFQGPKEEKLTSRLPTE